MKEYYVYILTNRSRMLYIGMTNDLHRRAYEHKQQKIDGFTKKYNITILVYYETTNDIHIAIAREKQLKGWKRKRKIALIEQDNPEWNNLSDGWYDSPRKEPQC